MLSKTEMSELTSFSTSDESCDHKAVNTSPGRNSRSHWWTSMVKDHQSQSEDDVSVNGWISYINRVEDIQYKCHVFIRCRHGEFMGFSWVVSIVNLGIAGIMVWEYQTLGNLSHRIFQRVPILWLIGQSFVLQKDNTNQRYTST